MSQDSWLTEEREEPQQLVNLERYRECFYDVPFRFPFKKVVAVKSKRIRESICDP